MGEFIKFFTENGLEIISAIGMIVAGASALANFTKTDKDNKALGFVSKLLNLLALNFKSGKIK